MQILDEWALRVLADAVRPWLPRLVGDDDAARVAAQLDSALALPPGRAKAALRRLLLADERLLAWALPRLRPWRDTYRSDSGVDVAVDEDLQYRGLGRPSAGSDESSMDARELTFTVEGRTADAQQPLTVGTAYRGSFTVGQDPRNLFGGAVTVMAGEIGAAGLDTEWIVFSSDVRFEDDEPEPDPAVVVDVIEAGDDLRYAATFGLRIPPLGEAERRRLRLIPLSGPQVRLDAEIRVGNDVYRRLTATLAVAVPTVPTEPNPTVVTSRDPAITVVEQTVVTADHTDLVPAEDYQLPGRTVEITVAGHSVVVSDSATGRPRVLTWQTDRAGIATAMQGLHRALDQLRGRPADLEPGNPETLLAELGAYDPTGPWFDSKNDTTVDEEFARLHPEQATGRPLRKLAAQGRALYDALFPDSQLRSVIESLEPGDKVTFTWLRGSEADVPDLALPLLYLHLPPGRDEPVDPRWFAGLRFRIGHMARPTPDHTRSLGDWVNTTRGHLVYWGKAPGDAVGEEAERHLRDLATWGPSPVLPSDRAAPLISELAGFLEAPDPLPVSLLYFYCHCESVGGLDPVLRFGPTNAATDQLEFDDLVSGPIGGAPVAFVNACGSQGAAAGMTSQLMTTFLNRGCRAFIGTETEVPARLAAIFATVFFHFLYGGAGRSQAPVGESISQARRFLWRRERNVGGLFYNYVNDYLLYAADRATVADMRRPKLAERALEAY